MPKPVLLLPSKREKPDQGWACLTCGAWFQKDQHRQFERHAVSCAADNEHIERDLSLQRRLGIFAGVPVDAEFEAWVKRHSRALIEKRMRM